MLFNSNLVVCFVVHLIYSYDVVLCSFKFRIYNYGVSGFEIMKQAYQLVTPL